MLVSSHQLLAGLPTASQVLSPPPPARLPDSSFLAMPSAPSGPFHGSPALLPVPLTCLPASNKTSSRPASTELQDGHVRDPSNDDGADDGADFMPSPVPSLLLELTHLGLPAALSRKCYHYPHFPDDKTEAHGGEVICRDRTGVDNEARVRT